MARKPTSAVLPSELDLAPVYTHQARTYKDCRHYWLDEAERIRWARSTSPLLAGLQVFSCGEFVEAWGHMWERKNLPEGVLIYCIAGKGYYQSENRDWAVQAGDLLYAPPDSHHLYWADGHQPWTIYWIHLAGPLLSHYEKLLGLIRNGPVRHLGIREELILDFNRVIMNMPSPGDEATRWLCLQAAAVSLFGHLASLPVNMEDLVSAYGPIQKAIALMNDSLGQAFNMARFARAAGCSERHFLRRFRMVTGSSPSDWFIRQKIQRAGALLTIPHIRVKEVASRLGYEDPLYFSKVFRRLAGLSPEEYRKTFTGNHV